MTAARILLEEMNAIRGEREGRRAVAWNKDLWTASDPVVEPSAMHSQKAAK